MTPEQKTEKLFGILTGCYGSPEMKDGQDIKYVKRIWSIMLERYDWDTIKQAATDYMSNARWNKWPSTGEFKITCDEFKNLKAKPADGFKNMPEDWRGDLNSFAAWWNNLNGSYGFYTKDTLLDWFLAREGITNSGFADAGVQAFRKGIIQNWERVVADYTKVINDHINARRKSVENGLSLCEINTYKNVVHDKIND